jgi:hypothetical protein
MGLPGSAPIPIQKISRVRGHIRRGRAPGLLPLV